MNVAKMRIDKGVADVELLGDEVAGGGAQRKGEQDRQPVEGLAARRHDRADRERVLTAYETANRSARMR